MSDKDGLKQKLFSIVTKKRSYSDHPFIVSPESISPVPVEKLFLRPENIRILELGAGWGEFIVQWAQLHQNHNAVTFEVKSDRIHHLLKQLEKKSIENVRVMPVNFSWFLEEILPVESFDLVFVNFPDPWPKRRHWKHRLINKNFPARISKLMKPGATIHLATDYTPYARKMLLAFRSDDEFECLTPGSGLTPERPNGIPETRFERIQSRAGYRPLFSQWKKIKKK